ISGQIWHEFCASFIISMGYGKTGLELRTKGPERIPRFRGSSLLDSMGEAVWTGEWLSDWKAAIYEYQSALYANDIQKSLNLQSILDLYPLHKRILGLVEYL